MTLAAAGAMRCRHLPDGGIEWLLVKAWYVLHRAMRPALYCHIYMAIKIASYLPAFFGVVDFIVGHNHS
jgi:hypothetical protein